MIKVEIQSQILDYLKRNWKELLIAALFLALYINGRMDYASLYKIHEESISQYEDRIEQINIAHKEQLRKKDESIKEYIQRVEDIRLQHDEAKEELERTTDKSREKFRQILEEKPEDLINEIENTFGFEYVE